MPICERSLQDKISTEGPFCTSSLCDIVLDILSGLTEVGDIIHRDLKPGNILFLDGCWRLADFGIAKFVEDSTSLNTLRRNLTPAYGAPEQWRGEAPSHATDVYALGCIVHTMLTGTPPFQGSADQVREAHLHTPAPALPHADARLVGFVNQMLRKSPVARPSLARCIEVFTSISQGGSNPVPNALVEAAAQVAAAAADADAASHAAESRARAREDLIAEAEAELVQIKDRLFAAVLALSEEASVSKDVLRLGSGSLQIGQIEKIRPVAVRLGCLRVLPNIR
jgi:serine/threonine-protein kinase